VTLEMMILQGRAVMRGSQHALVQRFLDLTHIRRPF
jgi:ketopantoate hydroxymethyltransferase